MTPYPWPDLESKRIADQRTWSMLPHLAVFANFAFPFAGVAVSLIVYFQRSNDRRFARENQRIALNYGLTVGIVNGLGQVYLSCQNFAIELAGRRDPNFMIARITHVYGFAVVLGAFLAICAVVACFAAHAAWFGKPYRYPVSIPFVRVKREGVLA